MRQLFFLVIFLTGMCSLGYQVIWQRYLGVLVGSEARSTTLVVAIFLLGLAVGYYVFGKISEKIRSRKELLRFYGKVELVTGIYAIAFPSLFEVLFNTDVSSSNNFLVHILMTIGLCFLPTVLMGATIPVMTSVMVEDQKEVGRIHAIIYGVNTIGAFVGCLVGGMLLVPNLGFKIPLVALGFINALISFVYMGNKLEGDCLEKQEVETLEHPFHDYSLYIVGFIAGAISIALEILWFRIYGVSAGSSFLIFPFILAIFILSIGLGSLTLKKIDIDSFQKNLFFSVLFIVFAGMLTPFVPLWVNDIRVLFQTHEVTFYVYHISLFLFFVLLLFPGLFFLGRILPFAYAYLKKDSKDYGFKCGLLYFLNTLGTFLGATLFSYALFYVFNLDIIFKILILILFATSSYFFIKAKNFKILALLSVVVLVGVLKEWDRSLYTSSLFRKRMASEWNYSNPIEVLEKKKKSINPLFFRDGPSTTTAILESKTDGITSKSIFLNGKSDGDTVGDFGTTTLLALYPYLVTQGKDLTSAIIGIGTGITAGTLAEFERTKSLDVIEISDTVIESSDYMAPENYSFHKNPKVKIHKQDAFQFFKNKKRVYDIVVSEPTNPWVIGVENLYTDYFYKMMSDSLKTNGVLAQWIHIYSMNEEIFITILKNMKKQFPSIRVFYSHQGDVVFLGKKSKEESILDYRLANEPMVKKFVDTTKIGSVKHLELFEMFTPRDVDLLVKTKKTFEHDIFEPKLGVKAYRAFFMGQEIIPESLINPFYARLTHRKIDYERKVIHLRNLMGKVKCPSDYNKMKRIILCDIVWVKNDGFFRGLSSKDISKKLMSYERLRVKKYIPVDNRLLASVRNEIIKNWEKIELRGYFKKMALRLLDEYTKDGSYALAANWLQDMIQKQIISREEHKRLARRSVALRENAKKLGLIK